MCEKENMWDLWRVVDVVSLSVAGLCCAFLAWWAGALLPTVVFGFTASFLLFSAAYEAATGGLSRFKEGSENRSGETEPVDENPPSLQDILRKELSVVREGFEKLGKKTASFHRYLRSFFTKIGPVEEGPSARQREIWYEDILGQSVPQVKESLRKKNLDLEAVLRAEKRRRNRENLVRWLKELVERDSDDYGR